jgi:C4-dicarboxylate transporter/malic acid transport protein
MPPTLHQPAPPGRTPARHQLARAGLLTDLEHPRQVLGNITPNWYASIMGTGIVATAAVSLPLQFTGLRAFATVVWAAAALLLVGLTGVTLLHWRRHRETARGHHLDPVMSHFYGAPPMAMLTVGAGTLLLGRDVLGLRAAVDIDWVLWCAGTVTGLLAAAAVPYLQFTQHDEVDERSPFGGWLMPIVPPMVSASTGALLVPYAPAGQARLTLLLCCYAMFGLSLIASLIIITLIWQRLAMHKTGPARMVPTLWIVLGPLGQSITAANLLGGVAAFAVPRPYSTAMAAFAVVYGVPVWGFAVLWAVLAAAITVRTARRHLPFSLTWWSFTFPVGTCVTGTSGLALHTGAVMFRGAAVVFYAGLLAAWVTVAVRTAHGSTRGRLFLPAQGQKATEQPETEGAPHAGDY